MEPTEPKSWKWIQGIVVVLAAAIGVGIAVWYQGRPVDTSVVPPPTVTPKKMKLRPAQPYVTPSVLAPKATPDKTASAASDNADDTLPVPSQSPVNNWQKEAVDPSVHIQPPAANGSPSPFGTNTTAPTSPSPYGIASPGAPGTTPSPYAPTVATGAPSTVVSPYPSSSPSGLPSGGAPVAPGDGAAGAPSLGIGSGTGPVTTGGTGDASGGTASPTAPAGTGGPTTGF